MVHTGDLVCSHWILFESESVWLVFLYFSLKKCLIGLLLQEISEEKVKVFDTLILEKCVLIGLLQEISDNGSHWRSFLKVFWLVYYRIYWLVHTRVRSHLVLFESGWLVYCYFSWKSAWLFITGDIGGTGAGVWQKGERVAAETGWRGRDGDWKKYLIILLSKNGRGWDGNLEKYWIIFF